MCILVFSFPSFFLLFHADGGDIAAPASSSRAMTPATEDKCTVSPSAARCINRATPSVDPARLTSTATATLTGGKT